MKLLSYWHDSVGDKPDYRGREVPAEVDVAIVGGGLTGLAAALTVAKAGGSVALFERDVLGAGASGRNGGMATTGLAIPFTTAVRRYGADAATAMFRAYNDAIDTIERIVTEESIECGFARTGKLTLAAKPSHYERMARSAELMHDLTGQEVTLVPRRSQREEIASDHYHGAMVDPLGAAVHVGELVYGLADAAARHGASLHESCAVLDVRDAGGRKRVRTMMGDVTASRVVMATGALTGGLMPWLRRRIIPVGSFIIVTEPLPEKIAQDLLPHRRVASDSNHLLYYFRMTDDDRLLFGGRARFAVSSPSADIRSGEILRDGMADVFPQLQGIGVDYCWGGLVDMSLDQMVHAGQAGGIDYSAGYSGHGVQMATHMGVYLGERLTGGTPANPWADLPFRAVPGHFGPPWFLPPVGLFFKVLDRVG